jgi:hypothetical protein
VLKHVKSRAEKAAAEEIANREPCNDFDRFTPLFGEVKQGLRDGAWESQPFAQDAEVKLPNIQQGDVFILQGQIAYIAEKSEEIKTSIAAR